MSLYVKISRWGWKLWEMTSHAGLVEGGGCAGGEGRVGLGAVFQQQPHTLQTTGRTGITQRRAPIHVSRIHLKGLHDTRMKTKVLRPSVSLEVWTMTVSLVHLSSSFQQQSDTLGLPTDACFVQWCNRVYSHNVDWRSTLDQVLQLSGLTLWCCFVHFCSLWPAACRRMNTVCVFLCLCAQSIIRYTLLLLI